MNSYLKGKKETNELNITKPILDVRLSRIVIKDDDERVNRMQILTKLNNKNSSTFAHPDTMKPVINALEELIKETRK